MKELLFIKLEAAAMFIFSLFAITQPNQELALMGWSILGSLLGGAVFAYLSQPKNFKEWMLRWVVNVAAGVVMGITIGSQYSDKFPNISPFIFTMFCAFFAGPLTVLLIPIGIPALKTFFRKWLNKKTSSDKEEN